MLAASLKRRLERPTNRISFWFYTFCNLFILNSVLALVGSGCDARGARGLSPAGQLLATSEASSRSSFPLVPSEAKLDLGQTAPGGQKSRTFRLTNQSAVNVEVVEITSSCDCLRVELEERNLASGQMVEGRIELDLRKEPQFLGNLVINVKGRGKKGETVFEMEILVDVDGN